MYVYRSDYSLYERNMQMDLNISGKRAVITGGSKGIGREIALTLSKDCLLYTSPSPRD